MNFSMQQRNHPSSSKNSLHGVLCKVKRGKDMTGCLLNDRSWNKQSFETGYALHRNSRCNLPSSFKKDTLIKDSFHKHCVECHVLKRKVKGGRSACVIRVGSCLEKFRAFEENIWGSRFLGDATGRKKEPIPMKDGRILVWELKEMLKSAVLSKEGVIREAF